MFLSIVMESLTISQYQNKAPHLLGEKNKNVEGGLYMLLAETTSFLDSSIFEFVTSGAKSIIGLLSVQPMGTFVGIGLVGAVAGLVSMIVRMVRK